MENSSFIGDLTLFEDNIGNGAFGSVYQAKYKQEMCAAKLLSQHARDMLIAGTIVGRMHDAAVEAFRKECFFLERLVHKNIVRHITTSIEPKAKLPILVMELMDSNLAKYIEAHNPLDLGHQLAICRGVSCGLHYLHSNDIIHRDLCDDNVLLRGPPNLSVKISDFGMSTILNYRSMSASMTAVGHRKGYLPPEGMGIDTSDDEEDANDSDGVRYSHRLDIYSFGAVATQTIQSAGHLMNRRELMRTFKRISDGHPLKGTIADCISKDSQQRPNAADVSKIIASILSHDS